VFPGEEERDIIHPVLSRNKEQNDFCKRLYSGKRATMYLRYNFDHHLSLCKVIYRLMAFNKGSVPSTWIEDCMTLCHFLVASLSYPGPAEAVLSRASQELARYEKGDAKAGFKEYFQPLLTMLQLGQMINDKAMMHLLCQMAALLVMQSRRIQQSSKPYLFEVHTQYLEQLIVTQLSGPLFKEWTDVYIPWADKAVETRLDG
jgi:hypothetical protein